VPEHQERLRAYREDYYARPEVRIRRAERQRETVAKSKIDPEMHRQRMLRQNELRRINRKRADHRLSRPGYVYVISTWYRAIQYYKIGVTINVERRLDDLSTAMPVFPILEHSFATDDMHTIETALHDKYRHQRAKDNREWFILSKADLCYLKSIVTWTNGCLVFKENQ
jgi:hypothetical protein